MIVSGAVSGHMSVILHFPSEMETNGNSLSTSYHEVSRQIDDGREIDALRYVFELPPEELDILRNNPLKVVDAIDEFGTSKFLQNVGRHKGQLVTEQIRNVQPGTMVELGSYIGYSSVLFGYYVRAYGPKGAKLISIEHNPLFGAITMAFIELAGLKDTVDVIIGGSTESIRRLHDQGRLDSIDLMFMDHLRPLFLTDLKLAETLRLIHPGTLVIANKILKPGNQAYLRYLRLPTEEKQYESDLKKDRIGDWRYCYDSTMIETIEPTGTKVRSSSLACVGFPRPY
ncbi:S-adenosyl-L-methionine-dependent methyltransferase [Ascobolus immersus RN42]|uniref:catechol O-methyltransferase n=1 Tax=Ascobolus immersus RN42 TaxID=1160509 RepID=A0A3N4I012_ASCIM|nr:S-adenosyl-L-methionine-dependent methyltransferase [Ascobolus immersus RN42]